MAQAVRTSCVWTRAIFIKALLDRTPRSSHGLLLVPPNNNPKFYVSHASSSSSSWPRVHNRSSAVCTRHPAMLIHILIIILQVRCFSSLSLSLFNFFSRRFVAAIELFSIPRRRRRRGRVKSLFRKNSSIRFVKWTADGMKNSITFPLSLSLLRILSKQMYY